jgi:hypothetical protein
MVPKTLGSTITLTDIKECVKEKKSIELTATAGQVNLDNAEIQSNINTVGHIALPPLNNKSEIFKAIWLINPNTDSLKWDYITLLTYLNNGEIIFKKIDEKKYLITIKF